MYGCVRPDGVFLLRRSAGRPGHSRPSTMREPPLSDRARAGAIVSAAVGVCRCNCTSGVRHFFSINPSPACRVVWRSNVRPVVLKEERLHDARGRVASERFRGATRRARVGIPVDVTYCFPERYAVRYKSNLDPVIEQRDFIAGLITKFWGTTFTCGWNFCFKVFNIQFFFA